MPGMRQTLLRLVRFTHDPGVGRDPIDFPGLASIIGECLLEMTPVRSDIRYDKTNKDGSAYLATI